MRIAAVRITLSDLPKGANGSMLAVCSVRLEGGLGSIFINGVKVVSAPGGRLLVAMPSQKVTMPCQHCNFGNQMVAKFCNNCGKPISSPPPGLISRGGHTDIVHPANQETRMRLEAAVLQAYYDKVSEQAPTNQSIGES